MTCVGKERLTAAGRITLPVAIASPIRTVPANRITLPGTIRTRMPAASTTRAPASTWSSPKRRPSRGANTENRPKQSTGTVPIIPAIAGPRPVSSRISPISGPVPVMTARRFTAASTIPASIRPRAGNPARRRSPSAEPRPILGVAQPSSEKPGGALEV